jgi:di/tricarboxylate transporter
VRTFVILAVAFVLLLTERLRNDVVAILFVLALAVSGPLKPEKARSGFGSEPAYGDGALRVPAAG